MSDPALTPEQDASVQAQVETYALAEDVRREGLTVSTLRQREETLEAEKKHLNETAAELRREVESIPDNRGLREHLATLRAERDALRGAR